MEECPERLVEGGKCVFGTFAGHPERLDIRNVSRAYLDLPIPKVITNLRIKSRLSFFFTIGEYIGCVDFFDAKIVGMADVNFWNQTTKQRFSYRSVMGPRKRFVPHKLNQAGTSSYKKSRYIRINWDREHDKLSAIFNLTDSQVATVIWIRIDVLSPKLVMKRNILTYRNGRYFYLLQETQLCL